MKKKQVLYTFALSILVISAFAQSVKDSSFRIIMTGVHFGGQMPGGDLQQRFGTNLSAGANVVWKTKKNLMYSVEASYFFGNRVKQDVVANMRNEKGKITDNEGYPADLRLTERGWNIYAKVGYLINKLGKNPNSGLMINVGAGWMQHKINLYDAAKKVAAVKGDLKKGYDHLTGGFALSQFIGYQYLSNNRLANFYVGLEFYEGFTKNLRGYNYTTGTYDDKQRLDIMMGARFGWILPLYKRTKDIYYY
jgi:hypothetical protein